MARTAITVNALPGHAGLTEPAGTTIDATNHHVITPPRTAGHLILRLANTAGADKVVTVKAGAGVQSNVPADLAVTVPATSGVKWVGPFEAQRFAQADGTIQVDVAAATAGTITAYSIPKPF